MSVPTTNAVGTPLNPAYIARLEALAQLDDAAIIQMVDTTVNDLLSLVHDYKKAKGIEFSPWVEEGPAPEQGWFEQAYGLVNGWVNEMADLLIEMEEVDDDGDE